MKVIDAKAELISEKNQYKRVEAAARTCYKSESKISDSSAEKMCRGLIKSQHTAMLEHAVFCFEIGHAPVTNPTYPLEVAALNKYVNDMHTYKYLHVTSVPVHDHATNTSKTRILISGSARAICERHINDPIFRALTDAYPGLVWNNETTFGDDTYPEVTAKIVDIDSYDDLTLFEIGEHKVLTFRFTTDRGVSHELVRHRPCSFAQESTRYCLYSKDQFGNELTFIRPSTFDSWTQEKQLDYLSTLKCIESCYLRLVGGNDALQAQQARAILPNSVKTEIVVTANMKEWDHIFNLRVHGTTGAPHPDIKYVMQQALDIARMDPIAGKYLSR